MSDDNDPFIIYDEIPTMMNAYDGSTLSQDLIDADRVLTRGYGHILLGIEPFGIDALGSYERQLRYQTPRGRRERISGRNLAATICLNGAAKPEATFTSEKPLTKRQKRRHRAKR